MWSKLLFCWLLWKLLIAQKCSVMRNSKRLCAYLCFLGKGKWCLDFSIKPPLPQHLSPLLIFTTTSSFPWGFSLHMPPWNLQKTRGRIPQGRLHLLLEKISGISSLRNEIQNAWRLKRDGGRIERGEWRNPAQPGWGRADPQWNDPAGPGLLGITEKSWASGVGGDRCRQWASGGYARGNTADGKTPGQMHSHFITGEAWLPARV